MEISKTVLNQFKNLKKEQCIEWIKSKKQNPKNPLTGRTLQQNTERFNALDKICKQKYPELYENETEELAKSILPKKVGNLLVPQNISDWNNIKYTYFKNIYEIINRFKLITEIDYKNFRNFVKICDLCLEHNIVPESEIDYVIKMRDDFELYVDGDLDDMDNRNRYGIKILSRYFENEYDKKISDDKIIGKIIGNEIHNEIRNIIIHGIDNLNQRNHLYITQMILAIIYKNLIDEEKITDDIYKQINDLPIIELYKIYQQFLKEMYEYEVEKKKNYSIKGETKSRSLPKSISQKEEIIRIRKAPYQIEVSDENEPGKKKKKTIIPGVNAPEEYNERKQIIDIPKTDRTTFRSHSKLSKISNFPEEISIEQLEGKLEKLPDKKRKEILHELRNVCIEMRDPISGIRFDRMNKKNLQLILNIGNKNKDGKQYCFYVRGLYKSWTNQIKNNDIKITVPISGTELKHEEKEKIMEKMKYIDNKAPNPDLMKLRRDPNLTLEFIPTADPMLEQIIIKRNYGIYSTVIFRLAHIPVNIELGDLKNAGLTETSSADQTSAVLKLYIQALFNNGAIMRSNFAPYTCCKIHLGPTKNIDYWTRENSKDKYKDGINLNKFLHMYNEIKPLISEGILRTIGM